jgi:hypothetical protein
MMMEWELTYEERGWSLNHERKHQAYHWRAAKVKEWRGAFERLALDAKIPPCKKIAIEVYTTFKTRRLQDPGNNMPAVKAAIDGVIDAGVIPDDIPEHVLYICYFASVYEKGRDSVTLLVKDFSDYP